jgi:uncharacterized membrane protein
MVLAALGGIVAVLTGDAAHDEAVVPQAAVALLSRHEDLGELVMWLLIGLAGVRVALAVRGAFRGVAAWSYLLAAWTVAGLVTYQGHIGGRVVFQHGVGTAPVQRAVSQPGAR